MPKRRAHGEGALFRRNKGTPRESWVARLYLEDGSRKEVYAQTQADARQKLEELKRAAELGLAMRSPRQTVGQFLQDWLENAAKPKLRPRTFKGYRTIVNHYLGPHLGPRPADEIDAPACPGLPEQTPIHRVGPRPWNCQRRHCDQREAGSRPCHGAGHTLGAHCAQPRTPGGRTTSNTARNPAS